MCERTNQLTNMGIDYARQLFFKLKKDLAKFDVEKGQVILLPKSCGSRRTRKKQHLATAKTVRTLIARHTQWHLVSNQNFLDRTPFRVSGT